MNLKQNIIHTNYDIPLLNQTDVAKKNSVLYQNGFPPIARHRNLKLLQGLHSNQYSQFRQQSVD